MNPIDRALRAVARACVGAGLALAVWTLWSGYHVARGDWRPLHRPAPSPQAPCCRTDTGLPLAARPQPSRPARG